MEDKIDRILLNQRTIMKNLAFGFKELKKDEILNQSLLTAIEETEKLFEKEEEKYSEVKETLIENSDKLREAKHKRKTFDEKEEELSDDLDKEVEGLGEILR